MKLIASKFKSRCRKCGRAVTVGENVYWEKNAGVIHKSCFEEKTLKGDDAKSVASKNYFLLVLRMYMYLAPLTYGPVYHAMGFNDATAYCLSFPLLIAILTGMKPTGYRVRVKWTSRRAYQGDIFGTLVLVEAGLSFLITWLAKNLVMILK